MKKILAYLLVALMFVSSFAACGNDTATEGNSDLKAAADYIYAMYKDKGTTTSKDFERTAQVMIGATKYAVVWTTDNDAVKITTSGTVATIDVDERSEAEVKYTLTATVTDADGNKESVSFNYTVPKFEGFTKIVEEAYKLETGASMDGACTLEGTITKIDTAYDSGYKNITVTIQVGDLVDQPIMCYRLTATDKSNDELLAQVAALAVGDYITVSGTIKNYNGIIEFDAGCTLDAVVKGEGNADVPTTPEDVVVPAGATEADIVDLAYAMEVGQKFAAPCTLTGTITSVDTVYSDQYQNVTVTIQVGDKADKLIQCFRLKGDGADKIKVGDVITVTGTLKNYNNTIEFDASCSLDKVEALEIDWASQYVGNYSAHIIPVADFANCTNGFTLTFDFARLTDGYSYWNFTLINNVDGWPKFLDEKYYDVKPTFSEWDFIDVNDTSVTSYSVTFTADAVAELLAGDGLGIQVYGIVAYNIKITPVAGEVAPGTETSQADIVKALYALNDGESLDGEYTLTGVIDSFKYTYSPDYSTVQLTIIVDGMTEYPIVCYKLGGEGIDVIEVGDTITVTGPLKNYMGTYEFNGCTLASYVKAGETPEPTPSVEKTQEEIVNALYALGDGESLDGEYTLVGVIDSFKYTYTPDFDNIQLTIIVNGMTDKPVVCYKLKGEGIDVVAVGDTITVTGPLKNYKGTYEFNGCTLVSYEKGEAVDTPAVEEPVAGETLVLNANDLTAGTLTENTTFGAFTITATADASVTIDGNKKISDSGIEFTQRIKLGGTGKVESRSVSFTTTGAATVTVYAMSSSGDTERNLLLMGADGTVLATNVVYGTVDNSTIPAAVYEITEAGTYYLGSEKSGINIYYIEVK